jgi:hypothetical protein
MSAEWAISLAPLFGLCCDVAAQIVCAHVLRKTGLSIIAGAAVGLIATAAVLAGSSASSAEWIGGLVTYLALAFGYWAFVNLNITSLRIRMLREILNSSDGISQADLVAEYSPEEFLRRRLARLKNAGQLSYDGDRWRLESGNLLVLARTLDAFRAVLLPARRNG